MFRKLTLDQVNQIPVYKEKWLEAALATSDTNVSKVKKLVHASYKKMGYRKPKRRHILVFDSPLECIHAFYLLNSVGTSVDLVGDDLVRRIERDIGDKPWVDVWDEIRGPLFTKITVEIIHLTKNQLWLVT